MLLQKEEQALAQRMAYAQKLRAAGLEKNDQKMLDQAEQYERQAMDYYTKRVQPFEMRRFTTPAREAASLRPRRRMRKKPAERVPTTAPKVFTA